MIRRFDPNVNPYADDLLRLTSAPQQRFPPAERRILARVIASKLYELEAYEVGSFAPELTVPFFLLWYVYRGENDRTVPVCVDVLLDTDLREDKELGRYDGNNNDVALIVISVGTNGVIELYNGPWSPWARKRVLSGIKQTRNGERISSAQDSSMIPPRSNADATRNYVGEDGSDFPPDIPGGGDSSGDGNYRDGGNGSNGGGSGGGNGEGGSNSSPGAGGTGELLNHPVLFSVDENTFNAILEQT